MVCPEQGERNWLNRNSIVPGTQDEPSTSGNQGLTAKMNLLQPTVCLHWTFDVLYIKFLHQVSQAPSEGWGQCIIPGYPKEGNHCHIHNEMSIKRAKKWWSTSPSIGCQNFILNHLQRLRRHYRRAISSTMQPFEVLSATSASRREMPWYSILPDIDWRAERLKSAMAADSEQITSHYQNRILAFRDWSWITINHSSIFVFGLPCFRK